MIKKVSAALAVASLALCLSSAVRHFQGAISNAEYKEQFLIGTIAWFVFATAAFTLKSRDQA